MLVLIATIPFGPALIPFPRKYPLFSLFSSFSILFLLLFLNNKSFRSQSFVLSAPEINLSPTALTMLTRVSVQFLFDSCLIPVHSAFNPHSIPVQSLSQSRRIFCLPPVKFPIFSSISSRKHFSFSLSRQIPFSLSPINFPYII